MVMRLGAAALVLTVGSFLLTYHFLTLSAPRVTAVEPTLEQAPLRDSNTTVRILFVGDMMFDRTIRSRVEIGKGESVFEKVEPLLRDADFVVGNLEGPITLNASHSVGTLPGDTGNTRFTFDPRIAGILAHYGFGLVSIGNNHITDFGREGVESTKGYLTNAHVAYVGDPFATSTEPVLKVVNGITVGFTAYNQFILPDADKTRAAVGRARALGADFVVVLVHWGDEYDSRPPDSVRALAASFAAAGADLILGTHSHVIGSVEDINTTRVYYSLGNFVFDQYWEESVRCGLAVKATLTKRGANTEVLYETKHTYLERGGATTLLCPQLYQEPSSLPTSY